LSMEEQARRSRELRETVRSVTDVVQAEEGSELLCLDTGDGMALAFFRDPISPIQSAIDIALACGARPGLAIRMGVHSGPVSRTVDINGKEHISGSGINTAQRVMDCGGPGHILL